MYIVPSKSIGQRLLHQQEIKLNRFIISNFNTDVCFHPGDIISIGEKDFEVQPNHLQI
jgi:hypothetical protein